MNTDTDRAILLSIDLNFAQDILNGIKRWEYRKTPPKLDKETIMVLYASKDMHAIIGDCIVTKVLQEPLDTLVEHTIKETTSTKERLQKYFQGLDICSALRVEEPRKYQKTISLNELRAKIPGFMPPQSFYYLRRDEPKFNFLFDLIDSRYKGTENKPKRLKSF
ncbi:MAG: ASCH domain-containing protein [Candidatus Micrarchaeales archaeon]